MSNIKIQPTVAKSLSDLYAWRNKQSTQQWHEDTGQGAVWPWHGKAREQLLTSDLEKKKKKRGGGKMFLLVPTKYLKTLLAVW